jgi:hypothetical protein
MDEGRLFTFLQQQDPPMLIEVLQNAYHAMTTKQRQAVSLNLRQSVGESPRPPLLQNRA